MAHDPGAREAVISLLTAAGFPEHVPPRRRKRDPEPADGFRAFTEEDGAVLAAWVPVGGGDHKRPGQTAESLKMAEAYADAARFSGWTAETGGIIWHHARVTRRADTALHFPTKPLPDPCRDCGGKLCAECARSHGLTAQHFNSAGICPNGHKLESED